jgi:pimeloyl-ACP methyl ester carboxylesterase
VNAAWIDRIRRVRRPRPPELEGGRWLETRAGRLRAVERGDAGAPAVLLVPDPPNGLEQLGPLVADLARDHRVLAVEAPGFGYSGTTPGWGYGLEAMADLLVELLEARPAVLGLTCVMTLPGLRAANRRPDLVRGLVLGQTAGPQELLGWARRVDPWGLVGTPVVGQLLVRTFSRRVARAWYRAALPRDADPAPLLDPALEALARGARFPLASSFQALRKADLRPEGLTSQAPAVVLFGTADRTHRRTDPASVLPLAPRAELRRLEGCGHFPDLERPDAFAAAVRDVGAGA